jgi:MYXO-CTERM domain-containing protein
VLPTPPDRVPVRRLTAALAAPVVALAMVGGPAVATPAAATPAARTSAKACKVGAVPDAIAWADAVFRGTVRSTKRNAARQVYVYLVDVEHVWKNSSVLVDAVRVEGPTAKKSPCSLGRLEPGTDMVVLATTRGSKYWTNAKHGTAPAAGPIVDAIQKELGAGTSRTPSGSAPTATPGAALVLLGLLGLAGVAVSNRRRSS